ncbi:MAG: EAL domain-containing protein [Firmicutes bacterium]|nr:EAL domain-containing protein [Bacillota bacterium]
MNYREMYLEYLNEEQNEELVNKLIELQNDSKSSEDPSVFLDVTHLLLNTYLSLQDFEAYISTIKSILEKQIYEDYKIIVDFVDKLISVLLKIEDFSELDATLNYRDRFISQNKQQIMMQKFYRAVCYEGLKENKKAISALLEIPDSISNNNVISKYLKLAMLYLKENNILEAKSMYNHALIFDKSEKNTMFSLVWSDILFQEGFYQQSLDKYQEYFIKSKIKNRYLDRYIYINIALGHLEEAWKFYLEYEPKISASLSKNYRKEFYDASVLLANELRKYDEAAKIQEKINLLDNKDMQIIDQFDGFFHLISEIGDKKIFINPRDIVLESFRSLDKLCKFQRIIFVSLTEDGYKVQTYKKGLLMDKQYSHLEIKDSILDLVFLSEDSYQVYSKEQLQSTFDYLNHQELNCEFVISLKVQNNHFGIQFVVAFLSNAIHFDYAHKLLLVTTKFISQKQSDLVYLKLETDHYKIYSTFFDNANSGIMKIEKGIVTLLDSNVKSLLDMENDIFSFEELQSNFSLENKLYLDDFLKQQTMVLLYHSPKHVDKWLQLSVIVQETIIFLAVEDVTSLKRLDLLHDTSIHSQNVNSLGNVSALETDFNKLLEASTLIYFQLIDHDTYLSHYSFETLEPLSYQMKEVFEEISKVYFINLYEGDTQGWYLLLKTIDKRVISRILNDFYDKINKNNIIEIPLLFHSFVLVLQKKHHFNEVKNQIISLFYKTMDKGNIVFYDKSITSETHLMKTIEINIETLISKDELLLEYHPIGLWKNQEIDLYEVTLHRSLLLGEPQLFQKALQNHNLQKKWDEFFVKAFIKQWKSTFLISTKSPKFVINLSSASFSDQTFLFELIKRMKKAKIPLQKIVFVYEYDSWLYEFVHTSIKRFQQMEVSFGIKHWSELELSNLNSLQLYDYAWLFPKEMDCFTLFSIKDLESINRCNIIYNHMDTTVTKSFLEEKEVSYLEGSFFKTCESIEAIHSSLN